MPTLGTLTSLDRACERRADKDWMDAAKVDGQARFLILVEFKPAISPNEDQSQASLRWFTRSDIDEFGLKREEPVFLGLGVDGAPHFSINITEHRARVVPEGPFVLKPYVDVRSLAMQGVLSPDELSTAGLARAVANWHTTQRCCGHCGSTNNKKDGGWRLKCWSCGQDHFPRVDPVVIMLVTDKDKCLIGREQRFPENFYSALAGFIEPGEDIEAAVRREVLEEVGIKVGAVHYQESQPWPFPHSLMIGCQAEALSTEITLEEEELADAKWVSRDEVQQMFAGKHPSGAQLPRPYAIARKLLLAFANG